MAREFELGPVEGFNPTLLVRQLGIDGHSLIKGHEVRIRECPGSQIFLPVIYLHGLYESVTDSGIPE